MCNFICITWYLGRTCLKKQVVGWQTLSRFCTYVLNCNTCITAILAILTCSCMQHHLMSWLKYFPPLFPRCSDLLQLIHSRSHLPLAFPTDLGGSSPSGSNLPGQMTDLIDLQKLQEDILATCIAGKPLIDEASIASMRIPFKFKEDISSLSLHIRYVLVYVHNDP